MIFAAVGDVHGQQKLMKRVLDNWEYANNKKIDFVLQVGDFEPIRFESDLESMACPSKYRKVGDFPEFYNGKYKFEQPVYFLSGNHEPYLFLDSLYQTPEEIAPNCTYLGRSGGININGLNIRFLSGIYSPRNYRNQKKGRLRGHKWGDASNKLFTYYFEKEVESHRNHTCDILMLHEWPEGAIEPSNKGGRFDRLGSEPARQLVDMLQPKLIIAGHNHFKHRSKINNSDFAAMSIINNEEDALGVFEVKEAATGLSIVELG